MRILIAASPGIGHIFPTVSTAWALRAAGHDVLLATSGYHDVAANAGLQVVDAAPGVDFSAIFRGFHAKFGGKIPTLDGQGDMAERMAFVGKLFAEVSAPLVDATVHLARRWRPDLVVTTPLQGAGPLAAAVAGAPLLVHGIGLGLFPQLWEGVAGHMAEHYDRFAVEVPKAASGLDVAPPSMRSVGDFGWPMRYVPYNGGAVLPSWLIEPPEKARVAVTLGSVVPAMGGVGALAPFAAAAGEVDAEFILALGGVDIAELGELPANVHPVDWIPLGALLRSCVAAIHHGGAGTTLTALDAGIPQYVLPHGADQFINAEAVAKCGAGAVVEPKDLTAERLHSLVDDIAMRAAAAAIADEMAAAPAPAELVPDIIGLVG